MLLPALQTTSTASEGRNLDALTLVLVVIFIASMAALTTLAARRSRPGESDNAAAPQPDSEIDKIEPPAPRTPRQHMPARSAQPIPAWLQGVTFPSGGGSLSEASRLIEELLAARRGQDLERGLALYAPDLLEELERQLGVDDAGLRATLREASFAGDSPVLRSVEVVSSTMERMSVRAGYGSGASETYRLVRIDGHWLIEGIDSR